MVHVRASATAAAAHTDTVLATPINKSREVPAEVKLSSCWYSVDRVFFAMARERVARPIPETSGIWTKTMPPQEGSTHAKPMHKEHWRRHN